MNDLYNILEGSVSQNFDLIIYVDILENHFFTINSIIHILGHTNISRT